MCGNLVRPDGHGVWHTARRAVPFWLEMDLGTEVLSRVAGKLTGYAHLAGTRRGYPVLFWLPTAAREANLVESFRALDLPPTRARHLARIGLATLIGTQSLERPVDRKRLLAVFDEYQQWLESATAGA